MPVPPWHSRLPRTTPILNERHLGSTAPPISPVFHSFAPPSTTTTCPNGDQRPRPGAASDPAAALRPTRAEARRHRAAPAAEKGQRPPPAPGPAPQALPLLTQPARDAQPSACPLPGTHPAPAFPQPPLALRQRPDPPRRTWQPPADRGPPQQRAPPPLTATAPAPSAAILDHPAQSSAAADVSRRVAR